MPHWGAAFLAGPAALLLLVATLSCAALAGAWSHRLDRLEGLVGRARARYERDRVLPMLWGLSAEILVFAVSVLLIQSHVLALLGVALLLGGLVVLSLGLCVAAWAAGDALGAWVGGGAGLPEALRRGVGALLLASCLPFIGWLLCLLLVASGTGAVLEALLGRE